ncbi:TVP38/TMEM64 family protein [Bacillus massiliglaciei]|uniref:TVP38/TMEM64 family protein n=1 Tax=Bacillus massiliglaciei TaxID=1816693 RepID=UPI000B32BD13|nr:TVP38/TMEM64 family protein [Bacillus massiliglaciei]
MDFDSIREWITQENIYEWIQEYRSLGPFVGILLTLLEAFLPFLPLFAFVLANANAFGLWWGFLFSWAGAVGGAFLVFMIFRKYGQAKFFHFLKKHKQVKKLMDWLDYHGFGPLFLLMCFPFTPSAIVNVVAGLSKISPVQFGLALICGKFVMIFTISYVGYDVVSLLHQPIRTAIVLIVIFILWFVGKRVEVRLNKSMKREKSK